MVGLGSGRQTIRYWKRKFLWEKNNGKCSKCGMKIEKKWEQSTADHNLTKSKNPKLIFRNGVFHHILELTKGGNNKKDNLILLCKTCHEYIHGQISEEHYQWYLKNFVHKTPQ